MVPHKELCNSEHDEFVFLKPRIKFNLNKIHTWAENQTHSVGVVQSIHHHSTNLPRML